MRRLPRFLASALVLAIGTIGAPASARADILVLTSGGTLSVKSYRIEGELITVALRRGGEATFDRSRVARIAEDELPAEPEPEPAELTVVPAPQRSPATLEALSQRPFADMIESTAQRHGLSPVLVHAVVRAESNYQPRARSTKGARGLMQVLPATARLLGAGNLFDPQSNLDAGVRYLKGLLAEFDLPLALAAYNAGPATVRRYGGVPPFAETRSYVERVLADLAQ
jgi:soluble lytic murein transglycosylase-like protein